MASDRLRWVMLGSLTVGLLGALRLAGPAVLVAAALLTFLAALWGPGRHDPSGAWVWNWGRAALGRFALAWALRALPAVLPPAEPTISGLDVALFNAGYVLLIIWLVRLNQRRDSGVDRAAWTDAALVAVAAAAVLADVLMATPIMPSASPVAYAAVISPPLFAAVVAAMLTRLLLTGGHRLAGAWMLATAAAAMLLADAWFILDGAVFTPGMHVAWLAAYLLVIGAVTHPSLAGLAAPHTASEDAAWRGRPTLDRARAAGGSAIAAAQRRGLPQRRGAHAVRARRLGVGAVVARRAVPAARAAGLRAPRPQQSRGGVVRGQPRGYDHRRSRGLRRAARGRGHPRAGRSRPRATGSARAWSRPPPTPAPARRQSSRSNPARRPASTTTTGSSSTPWPTSPTPRSPAGTPSSRCATRPATTP